MPRLWVAGLLACTLVACGGGDAGGVVCHRVAAEDPLEAVGDAVAAALHYIVREEIVPGAAVLELDGKMLDRPHLIQARRILGV